MNKIIQRYNLQKNKKIYYENGIDNYIANHLMIRNKIAEMQEQKETNKKIQQTVIKELNKTLEDIFN